MSGLPVGSAFCGNRGEGPALAGGLAMAVRFASAGGLGSESAPGPGRPRRGRRWVGWLVAIGVASLVAGVMLPRMANAWDARQRQRCVRNLRRIGAALQQYEQRWGTLPPAAVVDSRGEPRLSWRVLILPELGLTSLYEDFHRDEAWNSPHNRGLVGRMPDLYRCPGALGPAGTTGYLAIHGPQAYFDGREGVASTSATDSASSTLLVAESSRWVEWSRPVDHEYRPLDLGSPAPSPLPSFGSGHGEGYQGLFGDGLTRFLRRHLREETLRALMTRDGGEAIGEA